MFDQGPWPHLWFLYTFPSDRRTGGQGFLGAYLRNLNFGMMNILTPNTPKQRLIAEMFIIGFTKDAALLQLHFLGNFEGMKLSHFRHHQCCGRCVSMAKSFGTFCSSAARDLGWGMHGDASKNEFRLCSSSTQRLVQQIKGFTKPFFSVVNCSALMGH